MSCLINEGYVLGCRDNVGGVKGIWISSFDGEATYADTTGEITTVTPGTTNVVTYYKYEQLMEVPSFAQTGNFSLDNGTVFYEQTLALSLHKQNTELRNKLILLSQAKLSVIIKDQNGNYWLVGKDNGLFASAADLQTGKAFGDMNGVALTLQGKEAEPAIRIAVDTDAELNTVAGFNIG